MSKINDIQYLVGSKNFETKPFRPYNIITCEFLIEFSKKLNLQKDANRLSDLKALAFWTRKQNVENLVKKSISSDERVGLGLLFHITPSNIATNFIYSLFFGLLTGNSNIIKISSKKTIQSEIICRCLNQILKKKKFEKLKKRITIIRYNDNDIYTKNISYKCNLRIIWGGDETIKAIRKFELNPSATDITFADRSSICIINSGSIIKTNSFDLSILAEKFYNDTYLVDQNACSSPHIIFWQGARNINKIAQKKFWHKVYMLVKKKYNLEQNSAIAKHTLLCKKINFLKNNCNFIKYENFIYILKVKKFINNLDKLRGQWGLFFEYEVRDLNKISKHLNKKFQVFYVLQVFFLTSFSN